MTEWINRSERHVPEEEHHAYFDQALSRSQCAEIETHLSHCPKCQAQRAEVAMLRDRTTALLARLSPHPVIVPPPFQTLLDRRSRQLRFAMWRVRLERAGLWAAGIAAATGIGWMARTVLDPHRTASASAPIVEVQPPAAPAPRVLAMTPVDSEHANLDRARPAPIPETEPPVSGGGRRSSGPSAAALPSNQLAASVVDLGIAPAESTAVRSNAAESGDFFDRVWRVIQWDDAVKTLAGGLPYVEGLPVRGVQIRPGERGERPTVIVTQEVSGGELISAIEGPVDQVNQVLRRQAKDVHNSDATRTPPDYVDDPAGGLRRTLRVLTIAGKLSVDSLNALARVATIR